MDVTGAIPEQWNADELRRKFERSAQEDIGDIEATTGSSEVRKG